MAVTLFLVTGIAAAALGYVYDLTKGPIAVAKLKAQNEAIKIFKETEAEVFLKQAKEAFNDLE